MEPVLDSPHTGDRWSHPGHLPALGVAEVHVWRASVAAHAGHVDALRVLLEADERARADRFHFERDRRQFTVAHGVLRTLLARYLDRAPQSLRFTVGEFGKPALADAGALAFNLSHSGDLVLIAVARDLEIGVDVERWSPDIADAELLDLSRSFFSPAERDALAALPAGRQREGFFACWSRKEAWIKATGLGVSSGLDYFDVSLAPGEPARLLADRSASSTVERWTLCDLAPAPGYSGALAVAASDPRIVRLVAVPSIASLD